ncbi:MarR family winged helix-turn-helix transcriptional regulator [Tropicibacter naphthalenivorans]|uniref:Transcriptional regulator HosA n=1 Tax=Tropicibacter naphthalenivorans TaxID=441103 RepID=A0A0P1GGZ0_9RHOB|nr:MarR family transcriptional regulator [Tropicibacter naphthalenivorans]CUH80927.1 Transcriptional regulator HosA [Tropicibacter naphthalenivorans]SMC91184.1 transcriptional regulator, MarR family [Tropicibacter naphthalenivorans]
MTLNTMPGHLIRRLHQHSTQVFQQRMKAAGLDLTPVQFAAMGAVKDTPGIDQASIAAAIAYDRATIGGVIDRLISKGWVARNVSKRDRRAREVFLTDKGAQVFAEVLPLVAALQDDVLTGLSDAERAQFCALAQKVSDAFEAG